MTTETEQDRRLVRQFQRGDARAFELLVERHQDRIFRLAHVHSRVSADAADITQEVFLRAYTGLSAFRFRAAPFTWLYSMTKNVCREYNRKRKELPWLENSPEPSDDETGETELAREQTVRRIREIVARLPDRQRDAVLLRIFEDLSVDATAAVMGCRPGTVKALLHKALARIRRKEFGRDATAGDDEHD